MSTPLPALLRAAAALQDSAAAEVAYRAIRARAPGQPDANLLLAELLYQGGRQDEALPLAQAACRARPQDAGAHNLLGSVLQELNRPQDALACFGNALRLRPAYAGALRNRANTFLDEGDPAAALADYDAALRAKPPHPDAALNRALALRALGRVREAAAALAPLWDRAPDALDAGWHLALCRLLLGEFEAGWAGFELRRRMGMAPAGPPGVAPWHGEDPAGRTVLLRAEGGFGDAVQFCRLAPLLAARGARVRLEMPPELMPLLQVMDGVEAVAAATGGTGTAERVADRGVGQAADAAPAGAEDFWAPLLSLPWLLRLGDAVPATVPYLRLPEGAAARAEALLGPRRARWRVGVCWAGTRGAIARKRDAVPLDRFAALFAAPDCEFIVLQTSVTPADRAALARHPRVRLPDGVAHDTFADTAALAASCDVVVAADSTVAHLAGALALPTLLLLPLDPDWRWMSGRADSPWYPTARLLRQEAPGAWEGVVERAAAELG